MVYHHQQWVIKIRLMLKLECGRACCRVWVDQQCWINSQAMWGPGLEMAPGRQVGYLMALLLYLQAGRARPLGTAPINLWFHNKDRPGCRKGGVLHMYFHSLVTLSVCLLSQIASPADILCKSLPTRLSATDRSYFMTLILLSTVSPL